MYHVERKSQAEVARQLGLSRSRVSRLLARALDEGIVEIRVNPPGSAGFEELETLLRCRFGLVAAVVCETPRGGERAVSSAIGAAAAQFLAGHLEDGQVVGLSWGLTLHEMVEKLDEVPPRRIVVVPLLGGLGQAAPEYQVNELVRRMCMAFGGSGYYLHAPAFFDNASTKNALMQERHVKQVTELWGTLDLALVGIGGPVPGSAVSQKGELDEKSILQLLRSRAIGDVCTHFFDDRGRPVSLEARERFLGIDLKTLRNVPKVVAVAGGPSKVLSIMKAIEGGFVNCLITDRATSEEMLALQEADSGAGAGHTA